MSEVNSSQLRSAISASSWPPRFTGCKLLLKMNQHFLNMAFPYICLKQVWELLYKAVGLDWEGGHKGNCKKDTDQRKVGYTNIELRDMMGRIIKGGSSGSAGSTRWLCLATSCNSLCALYSGGNLWTNIYSRIYWSTVFSIQSTVMISKEDYLFQMQPSWLPQECLFSMTWCTECALLALSKTTYFLNWIETQFRLIFCWLVSLASLLSALGPCFSFSNLYIPFIEELIRNWIVRKKSGMDWLKYFGTNMQFFSKRIMW